MRSDDLNRLLADAGIASTWQAAAAQLGMIALRAVAPQLWRLLTQAAATGSVALVRRLETALMPAAAPDYARRIVEGIERDHPDWPASQRAEYARDAIRQWAVNEGAQPDDALLNALVEGAVQRMRADQERRNRALVEIRP